MAFHVIRYQGNTIDVVFSSVCHILPVAAMVQLHIKQLAFIISIVYRKASNHRYERKQDSGHENEGVQNLIGFRFKISIRFIWQYTCIKHCEIHRVSPVLAKQVVFRLSFPTESIRRTASVIISITCIIILTTKQILAVLCFYSKTDFWHSYCQILTDLDKILHTPIVVRSILVGRLRPRSARGRLQTRTTVFFSVILEVTTDAVVNFVAWAEPDPKQHFFRFLWYTSTILRAAYRKQFYPKPVVPLESGDSEGVDFASLESLWPGIWQIWAPEGCRKVVTWPSRKLKIFI